MLQGKTITYSFCITVEVLLASMIAILTAIGQTGLVSLLFAISFIVAFGYTLFDTLERKKMHIGGLLALSCLFSVLYSGIREEATFGFSYFKKLIMFCAFVFLLYYATKADFSVPISLLRALELASLVAGAFLVLSYYVLGNREQMAGGITLGFSNPNFTGMWLLHFFLLGVLFVIRAFDGGSKLRLLYIPILPFLLHLIGLTLARSCLFGVIFFLLSLVLSRLLYKIPRIVTWFVVLFPLVYAVLYLSIVDTEWVRETFSFLVSAGKDLNSRVDIWQASFENFRNAPIFGNYAGLGDGTGQFQLHNTHIDVLCSYGLLSLLLFLKFLSDRIVFVFKHARSFGDRAAVFAFCTVVAVGAFEAAMVAGSMGLNLLTVSFCVFALGSRSGYKRRTEHKGD